MTEVDTKSIGVRVGRGLGWSTASNLFMRVGNFLVSILMARLIAPEQFGVFAVALTVWSILGTLAEFGLGTDLVRAPDFAKRAPTVASLGLLTSAAFALTMAATAGPIASAFQSPASTSIIRLMSLSLAIFGFSIVPAAALQREFRQAALFAINGAGMLASATTMTILAVMGRGPVALAWGQIANQLVIVCGLYLVTRLRLSLGFDRKIARESVSFCLPLAIANLLSWLLLSVDNLVVARMMSPGQLGLYALAFNVSSWPMSAVGTAIRSVALPGFSRAGSTAARNRVLLACSAPVWAVAALMGATLAILGQPLISVLYGDRWRAAAVALTGLAVFGGFRVVFDLMVTFLVASGATRAVLSVQVVWLAAMVPAMTLGVAAFGLAGAGWAHVAVAVGVVLPCYLWCLHRVGVDAWGFLRGALLPGGGVIAAAAASWWLAGLAPTPVSGVVLGVTAMFLLYIAPLTRWWLRRVSGLMKGITAMPAEGNG